MKNLQKFIMLIVFTTACFSQKLAAQDVYAFLFSACGEERQESLVDRIKKAGNAIEPDLIKMVQEGPSQDRLQRVREHAQKKFEERKSRLANGTTLSMNQNLLELLQNESRQNYVRRTIRNYRDGMIKQAMSALVILNSDRGMQLLRKIRRNENSRYREHAIFVLRHFQR